MRVDKDGKQSPEGATQSPDIRHTEQDGRNLNKCTVCNPEPQETGKEQAREEHAKLRGMTVEEQKLFTEYSRDSYLHDMFVLALYTGMRSGELMGLEWKNVDFQNEVICVTNTLRYTNKKCFLSKPEAAMSQRDIPVLDNVANLLKQRRIRQLEGFARLGDRYEPGQGIEDLVFTTENGKPINGDMLRQEMNRIIARIQAEHAEFKQWTPHTLRYTFAARCIEKGIPPPTLNALLGHSDLSMTMELYE